MITTNVSSSASNRRYTHIQRIGTFQMVSGVFSIVLGLVGVIWHSNHPYQVGSGIWAGAFLVITGTVGYQSVERNAGGHAKKVFLAYMVLNIISIFSNAGAVYCAINTGVHASKWIACESKENHNLKMRFITLCTKYGGNSRAACVVNMVLAITLLANSAASITGSVLSVFRCGSEMDASASYTVVPASNQHSDNQEVLSQSSLMSPPMIASYSQYQLQQQQEQLQQPMLQQPPIPFPEFSRHPDLPLQYAEQQLQPGQQSVLSPSPMSIPQQFLHQQQYLLGQSPQQHQQQQEEMQVLRDKLEKQERQIEKLQQLQDAKYEKDLPERLQRLKRFLQISQPEHDL